MDRIGTCSRSLVVILAVVTTFTLLPGSAFAAAPCQMELASTPGARANLWQEALESFTAERPNLTAEQAQFLRQAVSLGDEIATLKQDALEQAAFARKATRFMERARELFSNNELGQLFTGMGQTQVWLAEMTAATAFCNCSGIGACQFSGGPSGDCKAGCESWDSDGVRYDGLCSRATDIE